MGDELDEWNQWDFVIQDICTRSICLGDFLFSIKVSLHNQDMLA